ncbi:MAG: VOC family protein [Candidatus Nanopelagicales bacterium]
MTIPTEPYPAGVPCWTDLMVADPASVQPFYSQVLGWTFTEPNAEYGGYVMGMVDGLPMAGMGPLQPGSRTAWTMYIASDDADAAAARVAEAGGTVLAPPMDVSDLGRMFVAQDPTGAVFGVWQAGTFPGGAANQPGGLVWEDLRSSGPDIAREFYGQVFSYTYDSVAMAPDDYTTFAAGDDPRPRGGIGGLMGAEDVPSHWLITFMVADMSRAVAAAADTGGAVPIPPFETEYGLMAGLTDPAGAAFWVMEPIADAS